MAENSGALRETISRLTRLLDKLPYTVCQVKYDVCLIVIKIPLLFI